MIKTYQVTLFCKSGAYRPVSALVKHEAVDINTNKVARKEVQLEGIKKICYKRYWTSKDLGKYNYTIAKVREYAPSEPIKVDKKV